MTTTTPTDEAETMTFQDPRQPGQPAQPQPPVGYQPSAPAGYPGPGAGYPTGGYPTGGHPAAGHQGPDAGHPFPPPVVDLDGARHPGELYRPLYGATIGQAVRRFFRKAGDFSGRASRSEYWWMQLVLGLAYLVPLAVMLAGSISGEAWLAENDPWHGSYGGGSMRLADTPSYGLFMVGLVAMLLVLLGMIVPQLALTWRRLHDANMSGAMYCLTFIPYVGSLIVLILTVQPSKVEGRRFDPYQR